MGQGTLRRGTTGSVIAALLTGFAVIVLLQPGIARALALPAALSGLAFPFQLCIGTFVAFMVCVAPAGTDGRGQPDGLRA